MQIKILQTTDPNVYYRMFELTSRVNREFCRINDIDYVGYIGMRAGCYPWHATFNRILLLDDALRDGYRGWIVYLDADAYVADLGFDLKRFLVENAQFSMIAAPGGPEYWCINAGIVLLNLASEFARTIVAKWNDAFQQRVGHDCLLAANQPWQDGITNDQVLLHEVLMHEDLRYELLVTDLAKIGAPTSTMIRQVLRQAGSLEERTTMVEDDTAHVLKKLHLHMRDAEHPCA